MRTKSLLLSFLFTATCFGQILPDRDELVRKFLEPATTDQAAGELIKHFQWGGLRTIIRNVPKLPLQDRLQYGEVLRHADLMRFRNDLNANLENATDPETKALFLMLLATVGRALDPSVFEPYIADESNPLFVRLAAASGVIKVQNPKNYDRFHELSNKAVIDYETGQNDFRFADVSKSNLGFYLYTKSQLEQDKAPNGVILSAIAMAESSGADIYTPILDGKRRKFFPLMIDRAIQVGGVTLLDAMASHRAARKFGDLIAQAKPAASAIARYRGQFMDTLDKTSAPIGPLLPRHGSGNASGLRAGYAVVEISEAGSVSIISHHNPNGGTDNLKELLPSSTLPAYLDWKPVKSYALVMAP